MLAIYVLTLCVSAALMFVVQPMFAKMVLPLLGGSPAVWNTQVVFCQAVLLLGYLYSHLTSEWLGVRKQAVVQCFLIFLPLVSLPVGIAGGWSPPVEENPVPWLFLVLLASLGLPFFVVSTISPMLQKWFASTSHVEASDPYFLYAASNAGSLFGLLGYPVLFEPYLSLEEQSRMWGIGYALLIILTLIGAVAVLKSEGARDHGRQEDSGIGATSRSSSPVLNLSRRFRWMLCAFAPSSLMLSVTTYLSTNIAPVPLLWVIPLAIYLASLILVFARRPFLPHGMVLRVFRVAALPLAIVIILQTKQPIWLLVPLHLVSFFTAALACHGVLARDRPGTVHLTEFYLWVSSGGILGGVFNVFAAPLLFPALGEYPLVVVVAALILAWPEPGETLEFGWSDITLPAGLGILTLLLFLTLQGSELHLDALVVSVPVAVCYFFSRRPARFGFGLGTIFLASLFYTAGQGRILHMERDFFGQHRVQLDPAEGYHILVHSGTLHGKQSLDPDRRCEPLSYYHSSGPLGQFFAAFGEEQRGWSVGVVGLGTGSMVSYSRPGQDWTLYEIDPTVVRIARDTRYFSYLTGCGIEARIVLGDARLSLSHEPDHRFDLLILDAYSSDSIPIHLVTREALALYLEKLTERGLLILHTSNQYLDLRPVLGSLAADAGLVCLMQDDLVISERQREAGKEPSRWALIARRLTDLGELSLDPRWERVHGSSTVDVWTDSYSSILSVLQWGRAR